ncbi:PTS transporter subunit EIIC [Enterococcus sp. BWT-B8]|uniref:PTS transporter subunit EIIC n=1 Tax=unclassified Enterococcus TaxID=2608891 RepID=UPI001E366BF3|nr:MULTISPECIES: PTS transporter subunit EIIC [unclassified Enterococcus]MCB5953372.1 PTS transporter subunit EIIC [Enterococcus sp. BWT-B8]MCB5954207.1 PTS transporter subunit EIIC [Enterococcus sp. CWB-B31]
MKEKIYNSIQSFSRSIIQPIMFMSISGIFISISAILRLEKMPIVISEIGNFFFTVIKSGTISNLSVIFCVGIAAAMAKKKKTDAAIMGISAFMIFLQANHYWLEFTNSLAEAGEKGLAGTGQAIVLGTQITDMGVFSGIAIGCFVAWFINHFSEVKFHKYLAAYQGSKFAYILLIFAIVIFSTAVTYVWPLINYLVTGLVGIISSTGSLGYGIYGFANRMLIPFGLHHLLWMPLYYTPLGGTAVVAGESYFGAMNIWLAEIGNISSITSIDPSVGYLANFGYTALPIAIAFALIKTARPENRQKVKAIVIPAVLAAVLGGITEPIEFIFLFTSPLLWFAHSIIYGLGLVLSNVFGLTMMVENLINTMMYLFVIPMKLGHQWLIPIIFVILFIIEYFTFVFLIKKFKIPTLGRTDMSDEEDKAVEISDAGNLNGKLAYIVEGLGGKENISNIANCVSRLRIDIIDDEKINEAMLKKYPSSGVILKNNHVQIVIGREVQNVRDDLEIFITGLGKQHPNSLGEK